MTKLEAKCFKPGPPAEVVCPHCLEAFPLWDMLFTGPSGESRKAQPSLKDQLLRRAPRFAIDSNGHPLREKQCPNCRRALPWTAGEQTDLIIGMVGAKYSGKSHYVATLVQRLQREVGRDFDAALIHVDQATVERYREEFFDPLYGSRRELPATQPGAKPLLYNFTVDGSVWGKRQASRSVTLALYDTAGEDFANDEAVDRFVKYLSRASGLIFLIDPLQTQAVREMVGGGAKLPDIHPDGNPQEILARVIRQLSLHGLLTRDRKLNIPVAIVFTKCDVLRKMELIDKYRLWQRDVHHQRYYDLTLHDDVSGLFSQLVEQWSLEAYTTIRVWMKEYAMFGVSATGCASDEDGQFPYISPWRVEDPLLWLLYRLGVIPGGRS